MLVSVLRPTLEYGSEVWACNKRQTASLESIQLGAAKKILGCSSKTCNEAVRGDMGLESLKGRMGRFENVQRGRDMAWKIGRHM